MKFSASDHFMNIFNIYRHQIHNIFSFVKEKGQRERESARARVCVCVFIVCLVCLCTKNVRSERAKMMIRDEIKILKPSLEMLRFHRTMRRSSAERKWSPSLFRERECIRKRCPKSNIRLTLHLITFSLTVNFGTRSSFTTNRTFNIIKSLSFLMNVYLFISVLFMCVLKYHLLLMWREWWIQVLYVVYICIVYFPQLYCFAWKKNSCIHCFTNNIKRVG
jgi:hypothetical protein